MIRQLNIPALTLAVGVLVLACGAPSAERAERGQGEPGRPRAPTRLVTGILGDLNTFSYAINAGIGSVRGVDETEKLVHSGLTVVDGRTGLMAPVLAEVAPTLENEGWRLLPGGRMETTWRIKEAARWHDGARFTADDLLFTARVGQDADIPNLSSPGFKAIERVEAPDERTVTVSWRQPYTEADRMFSPEFAMPLPRHLLERAYMEDRADFTQHPYFSQDFVGTGPFKLREFVRGSHAVLEANPAFALGRPKIDEIVVRFIPDPNTLIANVLAGEVQLTIGRGLSLEQALQVAGTWRDGRMDVKPSNWIAHYPQHLTPNPAVIGNAQFRRALLHGLDRQAMSDAFQNGQAPVAHTIFIPTEPEFREVEPQIVKYAYDARRAVQLIEGLGYARGADGFFRDAGGQRLSVETRTNAGDDLKDKILFSTADYWQQMGVGVDTFIVPRQAASDRELRATYPGFDLVRQPFEPLRFHGAESPLPTNRWAGQNRGRYMNAELDAVIERYFAAIPHAEHVQLLGQMLHHLSDQAVALGTFYGAEPLLIGNRLLNAGVAPPPRAAETWNAHQWELRG